eukprot:g27197.t1
MAFGMAWLVFWAVWVFLMPFSFLAGQMAVFKEMLTPLPFYYHNANVLLMTLELMNEEHCIFPVYFAYSYLYFNWYLYSKMGVWIYFFLDYNRPSSVPVSFCTIHGASRTARVSFLDAKHAASAVKDLSRSYIDGYNREIKVTYPYHRCQTEVRVSCLDKEVTEEELRKHFEKAGSVDEVEFITEEVPPEFKEHIIL